LQNGANLIGRLTTDFFRYFLWVNLNLYVYHAPILVQVAVQNLPWAILLVSTGSPYIS
jgi:hypothetical protein